jgi:transcriptional regulator with XRE-family HTH domain
MKGRELVAWNMRKLRTAQNLTQERLAHDAGLAPTHVGEIERAEKSVTVDVLDKLAAVLGVPISLLLQAPAEGEAPPKSLPSGRKPRSD